MSCVVEMSSNEIATGNNTVYVEQIEDLSNMLRRLLVMPLGF